MFTICSTEYVTLRPSFYVGLDEGKDRRGSGYVDSKVIVSSAVHTGSPVRRWRIWQAIVKPERSDPSGRWSISRFCHERN
jgi:hypothetical protein